MTFFVCFCWISCLCSSMISACISWFEWVSQCVRLCCGFNIIIYFNSRLLVISHVDMKNVVVSSLNCVQSIWIKQQNSKIDSHNKFDSKVELFLTTQTHAQNISFFLSLSVHFGWFFSFYYSLHIDSNEQTVCIWPKRTRKKK